MEHFGDYILLEKISSGGMADIFKAAKLGSSGFFKLLAIKRIKDHIARDAGFQKMFIREAHVQSSFSHPNVVNIYDFGREKEHYFIAMEYLNGVPLRNLLQMLRFRHERLHTVLILHILNSLLKGLDYIHTMVTPDGANMNIIHRDLDPRNVFLTFSGEIKLIDFGIADDEIEIGKNEAGLIKGKFSYIAPELLNGHSADQRSDVFSTGLLFYELLTLHKLFAAETEEQILENVSSLDIEKKVNALPVDDDLKEILCRALAREPQQRYASASEFYDALQLYQHRHDIRDASATFRSLMDHLFQDEQQEELKKNQFYFSILKDRDMADEDHTSIIDLAEAREEVDAVLDAEARSNTTTENVADSPAPLPSPTKRKWLFPLLFLGISALPVLLFLALKPKDIQEFRSVAPGRATQAETDTVNTSFDPFAGWKQSFTGRQAFSLLNVPSQGVILGSEKNEPILDAQIDVKGEPPGQTVFLDESKQGVLPFSIKTSPGFHSLECRKTGYYPHKVRVRASKEQSVSVDCILRKKSNAGAEGSLSRANEAAANEN